MKCWLNTLPGVTTSTGSSTHQYVSSFITHSSVGHFEIIFLLASLMVSFVTFA
jgi:hypothetical protein